MKTRIDSETQRRQNMNLDKAGNNLETFKARVQKRWKQLGDTQLERISGRRDRLAEELERTYGLSRTDAEAEIDEFENGDESSGRGPTERAREFGTGNDQGGAPRQDGNNGRHNVH
ncbi:MAG TPA: hypothetical protein VF254_06570 [Gammaproteobacteria bacterium]|jgi:hypothetical protein